MREHTPGIFMYDPEVKRHSDFVNELSLFRNPVKLLHEVKREAVDRPTLRQDKSILREVSADHWGRERGTS